MPKYLRGKYNKSKPYGPMTKQAYKASIGSKQYHRRAVSGPAFNSSTAVMPLFKSVKQPFVDNMLVKLKYHTSVSISSSAGLQGYNTFNLNSIFDPDQTNVGHQPRYTDQLFASGGPYLNYKVLATKIKVQFMNDNTSASALGYVGVFVRTDDASIPNDIDQWGELPNMKYKLLTTMNSKQPITITRYVNIARQLGIKDIADDDNAQALYNASPTDLVQCDVIYAPLDQATTTSIYAIVDLTYIVQCCDLQTIARS